MIGKDVAPSSTTLGNTIAIGNSVLYSATTANAGNSVFIGHEVGKNITTASASNNVYIGYQAGLSRNGQYENVAIGTSAGTGGSSKVAIGRNSMNIGGSSSLGIGHGVGANNSGAEAVIIGNAAGQSGATTESVLVGNWTARSAGGNYSVMMGHRANQNGTSHNSVHIGHSSGRENDGDSNVAVGYQTISETTTGSTISNSVALGYQALKGTTTSTAAGVVAVGYQALTALTTGTGNTAVGYQAGATLTTSTDNTFIGYLAGATVQTNTKRSVAIGREALNSATTYKSETVAIGDYAGNTSGQGNAYVGYKAGNQNTGGNYNTGIGWNALKGFGTTYSTALGYSAGTNSNGDYNVLLGASAGSSYNSSFSNTVAVGYQAGAALTAGGSNILIGYQAGSTLTTESNKLYIENSNSTTPLIYGEFDNDILRVNGTLQVNDPASTGYALPAATGTLGQVLEVNASGDLAFATPSGGGGGGLGGADQTLTADRTIDTNGFNLDIELDPTGTADTFTIHDGTHDLFQVDTTTTGTLFGVNDVSGLPMFQSNSDGTMALPQILTAAPTGTAPEGTMQLGIVSGTCYLYVYINGGWKSTTLT